MAESKSALDGIPVVETPEYKRVLQKNLNPPGPNLEVVSSCPKCGAPVYGWKKVMAGDTPYLQFTCTCRFPKTMEVETK